MKRAVLLALSLASTGALARADCPQYPKAEWMPKEQAKAKIEAMGYKIDKFKIDGNCYEIYGFNKEGKKAEVYFDAKTLNVIKAEIRK
ncbi:hypothetical protein AYO46_07070 [Betaproteobacteria bacterium SCGC AG-212-J23]|nr:hypothetical protein AYO46_07070 [Betaproteobacteria bacterium SCGC AG-212-J23]